MDMKFDPEDLKRLAELVVGNFDKIAELTEGHHADYVVTTQYDEMGRFMSETIRGVEGVARPRLSIELDGTVTRTAADGTETVVAKFE